MKFLAPQGLQRLVKAHAGRLEFKEELLDVDSYRCRQQMLAFRDISDKHGSQTILKASRALSQLSRP